MRPTEAHCALLKKSVNRRSQDYSKGCRKKVLLEWKLYTSYGIWALLSKFWHMSNNLTAPVLGCTRPSFHGIGGLELAPCDWVTMHCGTGAAPCAVLNCKCEHCKWAETICWLSLWAMHRCICSVHSVCSVLKYAVCSALLYHQCGWVCNDCAVCGAALQDYCAQCIAWLSVE